MYIFENTKIQSKQIWNGEHLYFDPDSSPAAWEHYKQCYCSQFFSAYLIDSPILLTYECPYYISKPQKEGNRLFALIKDASSQKDKDGNIRFSPCLRLGGETDFNFGDKNYKFLKELLIRDNEQEYISKLEKCREQHHCLINFSLMQAVGKMQRFKGSRCGNGCYDRLDKFIYYLRKFFDTARSKRGETDIIRYATESNKEYLLTFLNLFDCLEHYCSHIYFIDDKNLISDMEENGKIEITNAADVKRYIDLAFRFWESKVFHFSKSEFLTVGSYFLDGGEAYTYEELTFKLMNDLGIIDSKEIDTIIRKCLDHGFMHDCGNGYYIR